ncbi:MAG: hypothetical protein CM15mP54_08250 [Paracoccaceae bacterium]|nr:MAG: hypothetical protein CM15mP54_08250 [Paracoccaceae bacterium]
MVRPMRLLQIGFDPIIQFVEFIRFPMDRLILFLSHLGSVVQ